MKTFGKYIFEAKNTHMEHIEDSVWNEGSSGVKTALSFLESVVNMLEGHAKTKVNVTVKWDGAPAVFAGINPETRKFFVATKSMFNVNPKINYTNADIDKNHEGNLANKLKVALKYLSKLGIRGILQGDIMFTDDTSTQKIDGEKYLTFRPNTITYAVPADSDSAKEIESAKIGVVWHTSYSGKTIKDLKATFNPQVNKLAKTSQVWSKDADFKDTTGTSTFTQTETETVIKMIDNAKSLLSSSSSFIDELIVKKNIISELKVYGNILIRQGVNKSSAEDFITHIESKMQTSIDSLKTDKSKLNKTLLKNELLSYLRKNSKNLNSVFALHSALANIKLFIIRKLEQVKQIGTFIKTSDGFKVTAPEGFVAVDRLTNKALKLVDRLEFSKANFTVPKNWDK
tara:strand:+ start:1708 stop:2907 length:1200 start_codon:yes stop_codon:yes gene_type:complete